MRHSNHFVLVLLAAGLILGGLLTPVPRAAAQAAPTGSWAPAAPPPLRAGVLLPIANG